MRLGAILAGAAAICFAGPAAGQDRLLAAAAAAELREMCEADGGQLWGVSLCGPLMVVDPRTRGAWTSAPDSLGLFADAGSGWVGSLPPGVPVANTTLDWAGTRWIQVMAPLPEQPADRRVLLAHEAWHRAQDAIGLAAQPSDCAHLESERGRTLLRLELRALGTALRSAGRARRQAAQEALMFRAARLAEFPTAAAQEAALDRNEGLAAYTGVKLGVSDNPDLYAARVVDRYDRHEAFARSYAYATGPAYGLLLDGVRASWRAELARHAPADLLDATLAPSRGGHLQLRRAGERFGLTAIAAEERSRAETQRVRVAHLLARFTAGPRIELPLQNMEMVFNPNEVTPIEGAGTYYGVLTVRDVWGELRAEDGALISANFQRVVAAAPVENGLAGPGWRLTLAPGYQLLGPDAGGVLRLVEIPADAPPT
jgi:hypothetical protein